MYKVKYLFILILFLKICYDDGRKRLVGPEQIKEQVCD
jgi:hypothetical protein